MDAHITNAVSYHRKHERRDMSRNDDENSMRITKDEEIRFQLEQFARSQGLLMVPEFQFEHVIYQLTESVLSSEGLVYAYSKCMNFLHLRTRQELGLTCVVTPKWLMLCVMTEPYTESSSGLPCYLDGFAFTGLVNMQTVQKTWPATAGIDDAELSVLEAFERSCKTEKTVSALESN